MKKQQQQRQHQWTINRTSFRLQFTNHRLNKNHKLCCTTRVVIAVLLLYIQSLFAGKVSLSVCVLIILLQSIFLGKMKKRNQNRIGDKITAYGLVCHEIWYRFYSFFWDFNYWFCFIFQNTYAMISFIWKTITDSIKNDF